MVVIITYLQIAIDTNLFLSVLKEFNLLSYLPNSILIPITKDLLLPNLTTIFLSIPFYAKVLGERRGTVAI